MELLHKNIRAGCKWPGKRHFQWKLCLSTFLPLWHNILSSDLSFIMNILSKDTKTHNRPRKENKKKIIFFYISGFISFHNITVRRISYSFHFLALLFFSHWVVSDSRGPHVARQVPLSTRFSRQEHRSGLPFPAVTGLYQWATTEGLSFH